nr:hypothetical protein [Candidatus Sigynarchaeota archaeon]
MGASIGLDEPEPGNIMRQLSAFSRNIAQILVAEYPGLKKVLAPAVQYGNESDMYYDDPELVDVLASEWNAAVPVFPFIHETSDQEPLKPKFHEKMAQLLSLCRRFGTRNITVHLPIDPADKTAELLNEMCSPRFLKLVRDSCVSIDLENNWHACWFGFADHLVDFYAALDRRLDSEGNGKMKEWFGMTFDSGHFFAQYRIAGRKNRPDLDRLFTALGDRIRTLHLHGNDGTGDQHKCFVPLRDDLARDDMFAGNQQDLLACLPALDLANRARSGKWDIVIVSELCEPFTRDVYLDHSRILFDAILKK